MSMDQQKMQKTKQALNEVKTAYGSTDPVKARRINKRISRINTLS